MAYNIYYFLNTKTMANPAENLSLPEADNAEGAEAGLIPYDMGKLIELREEQDARFADGLKQSKSVKDVETIMEKWFLTSQSAGEILETCLQANLITYEEGTRKKKGKYIPGPEMKKSAANRLIKFLVNALQNDEMIDEITTEPDEIIEEARPDIQDVIEPENQNDNEQKADTPFFEKIKVVTKEEIPTVMQKWFKASLDNKQDGQDARELLRGIMDECVSAGYIDANEERSGFYTARTEWNEELSEEIILAYREFLKTLPKRKKKKHVLPKPQEVSQQPKEDKKKTGSQKPKSPLAITMNDGEIYESPQVFLKTYKNRAQETDQDAYKTEYSERLKEKLEEIKKRVNSAVQRVKTAIKIRRNPERTDGKSGVKDMVEEFIEEGLLTVNKKGKCVTPEGITVAESLAKAVNERIEEIILSNKIRNKNLINGFYHDEGKHICFTYQMKVGTDELGNKTITVYNLVRVYQGKPPIQEGSYTVGIDAPKMLISDEQELQKRQKRRENRKAEKQADQSSAKASDDTEESDSDSNNE
ncbi:hypothetical protein ACFL6I_21505 [candidate division KSB1 bacterium]